MSSSLASSVASTKPMNEDPTTNDLPQATTPMSVDYILNTSEPLLDKESQVSTLLPLSPSPAPPTATIAPASPSGHTDGATAPTALNLAMDTKPEIEAPSGASPQVPSTEDAHAVAAENVAIDGDVETKSEDNAGSNAQDLVEFMCMNDEYEACRTGQTTMDLSRKVISDHFGRNKACTRLITDWPLFCRKHYQRATYNQKLWQARKVTLILRQFNIIEAQFPGTLYTVALKKSEEQRLNTFSRKLAAGKTETEAAAFVAPAEKAKHFEAPVNVLREIEQLNYLGADKTKAEVEAAVNTISDMLESYDTLQVPSIEFLPQLDAAGTVYHTSDRAKSTKKSSARVSKKGAVTKPSSTKNSPRKSASKA